MATILVVDDDAASRLLAATLLEHAGHTVLQAENGVRALSIARETPPDLLLTDLAMPGGEGVDMIRALRRDTTLNGVTIVLYTATPKNAALGDFMGIYGVASVVSKPVDPQTFAATVERLIGAG